MYRESAQANIAPCDKCGKPKAVSMAVCPHCAGGGIARIELSAKTAEKLKQERSGMFSKPWPAWLRAIIFFLSFPVTVPSLIIHWLMAKRWGRVPVVSIVADGFILLFLCIWYPVLFAYVAVSLAATAFLFLRAVLRGRAESGIFLGYSNMVAMPLILGGMLTAIGVIAAVPSGTFRKASLAAVETTTFSVEDTIEMRVPVPKKVLLRDAKVRWSDRLAEDGSAFTDSATSANGRTWAPVDNTQGRVWLVATGPSSPPSKVSGLFVRVPPDTAGAIAKVRPKSFKPGVIPEFAILTSPDLYEPFGIVETKGAIDFKWLALGFMGVLLLGFATYRAVDEEEET